MTVVATPILHVDMDAFYASVEAIKDPSLRGKPVIVGGQGGRGVVTSASYEARAFGVHSAMPMIRARRLCPHAVFISNDFDAYQDHSARIRQIFTSFTPQVEMLSLDEAFLDVSGSIRLFGSPPEIALKIKKRVAALGLPCTVGVGPNKLIAKLASALGKPDGLLVVEPARMLEWLHPLPVAALWGVGEQTGDALRRLGLATVGDLARVSRRTLERAIGDAAGGHLHALANGRDDRPVVVDEPAKSIGSEETFPFDLDDTIQIARALLRLADRTAGRLRRKGMWGRTVTLKIRWSNFTTITRSVTNNAGFDTTQDIYRAVHSLYERVNPARPRIRLLGVGVAGLMPGPPNVQMDLLGDQGPKGRDAAAAVDSIRERFGDGAVGPAALIDQRRRRDRTPQ